MMRLHLRHQDGSVQVFDFKSERIRLGRSADCEMRFDNARYPKVSSFHAELNPGGDHWSLVPLSKTNKTLLNDQPIEEATEVSSGDQVRLGFTGPIIEIVSLSRDDSAPAGTLMADETKQVLQQLRSVANFDIGEGCLIGRDAAQSDFVLDHPHVSRLHCQITRSGSRVVVRDLAGANGTFVNGVRIKGPTELQQGMSLDVGPFLLELRGERLVGRSRRNNVQLVADQIGFVVESNDSGEPLRLLQEIELVINPGEFVCILGPSGSGKSTLLRSLSGRTAPSEGEACINGRNLHQNFEALKSDIAVIPQAISLHDSLSVEQSLLFSASIRLSPDFSLEERRQTVDSILKTVGLSERKAVRISQLSGGQLKRVGLAGELISDPSLLFLDEVTSGLDEQSDLEMMHLFQQLASSGKTLICVTHNLGHVADYCTHVAVLTKGGRLAFFGSPTEAMQYFAVDRLVDLYGKLEKHSPETWSKAFAKHAIFRRQVIDRKPARQKKKSQASLDRNSATLTAATWLRQFSTILGRTIAVWRNEPIALATIFGQPVMVAALLCIVFGRLSDIAETDALLRVTKTQNFLFLLNISCFWLGCNTSVKELVSERSTFVRERNVNLIPEAYFFAKLTFFVVIAVLQTLLLGIISLAWFDPSGSSLGILATLCFLALAGSTLGLAISALSKSEETAIAVVPLTVIPQIVLGGVVASLAGLAAWLAKGLATVFWGQHLLNHRLGESEQMAGDFDPSDQICLVAITIHVCFYLALTWIGVRRSKSA